MPTHPWFGSKTSTSSCDGVPYGPGIDARTWCAWWPWTATGSRNAVGADCDIIVCRLCDGWSSSSPCASGSSPHVDVSVNKLPWVSYTGWTRVLCAIVLLIYWRMERYKCTLRGASWFVLLTNVIRAIKSRRKRWLWHVARMGGMVAVGDRSCNCTQLPRVHTRPRTIDF
jgi:hypothetical protein